MPNINNFFQDQYPATDETQCLTVYIPSGDEFKWLMAGLLRLPTMTASYQDPDSEQAQGLADVWRDAYDLTDWGGCEEVTVSGMMSRVSLWHVNSSNDVGNAVVGQADATQFFGHYASQNAPTLNSQSSQLVQLQAGSWSMRMLYYGNNTSGKCQVYWLSQMDSSFGTIGAELDMYADGYNQWHTGTFTIPADGRYKIAWTNTGRNASNLTPFYRMYITFTELWRTGD